MGEVGLTAKGVAAVGLRRGGPLDEVIAVDGGGDQGLGQARGDELQHGHLRRGILHRHAVGAQPEVAHAALDVLGLGVVKVAVHHLLGVGQGAVETAADHLWGGAGRGKAGSSGRWAALKRPAKRERLFHALDGVITPFLRSTAAG